MDRELTQQVLAVLEVLLLSPLAKKWIYIKDIIKTWKGEAE